MALGLVFACKADIDPDSDSTDFDEGVLTECRLSIAVADFAVSSSTRAADPDTDADNTASDQEKAIDDIWVFQYDAAGKALIKPRYYTAESEEGEGDERHWLVLLKANVESTVYVVANTGAPTWAGTFTDFDTLDELKAQTLPNPDPIEVTGASEEFYIPMQGYTPNVTATDLSDAISVTVERMFAKLIISAKIVKGDMTLQSIAVNNIPWTCRVESRSCSDTDTEKEKEAADYPDTYWYTRSSDMSGTDYMDTGEKTSDNDKDIVRPVDADNYVIYIPENIQGEVDESAVNKLKGKGVPYNALTVTYYLDINLTEDDGSTSNTSGQAEVYPGGNTTNNFNIKRNRVYRVTGTFPTIQYFFPAPSANCFIVKPGESVTFWPYYRTETGGGYTIRTYLDPTDDALTIASVKVIWQDEGVIGDNSSGKLVTMSSLTADNVNVPDGLTEDEKTEYVYQYLRDQFKIRVQTAKEGNALVGAYNADGEVIWSWHIWVTDNDPGNVGNAIRYTTYEWDESGIKCNDKDPASVTRVPGYQVMPCNLGAKEFTPDVTGDPTDTYGPLFQWGRKDPFPSMKGTKKTAGFADYNNSETNTNSSSVVGANIHVYDNSNSLITMTGDGYVDGGSSEVFRTVSCLSTSSAASEDGQRADGLKYAINHPTTFIAAAKTAFRGNNDYNAEENYYNNGDWLLGHDNELWGGLEPDLSQHHLKVTNKYFYNWGNAYPTDIQPWMWDNYGDKKTIFDPSPTGWRVPPADFWLGFTATGESVHQRYFNNYNFALFEEKINSDDKEADIDSNNGFYLYLNGWKTGAKSFFPSPGTRLGSGQPFHLNFCGNYHCASGAPTVIDGAINGNERVNCFHVHAQSAKGSPTNTNQINPFECQRLYIYKSVAGPIRCVRDRK